jgi:hypothetical protein
LDDWVIELSRNWVIEFGDWAIELGDWAINPADLSD